MLQFLGVSSLDELLLWFGTQKFIAEKVNMMLNGEFKSLRIKNKISTLSFYCLEAISYKNKL